MGASGGERRQGGAGENPRASSSLLSDAGLGLGFTEGWGGLAEIRHVWALQGWDGGREKGEKHMKVCQNLHGVGCSSEAGAIENLVGKRQKERRAGRMVRLKG